MDWTSIIPELATFILGGGLVAIVTVPSAIRKAKIENESLATGPLKETNAQLRAEIERIETKYQALEVKYEETVAKSEAKIQACVDRYENKCEESATAKSMMCVHLGCSLRDPLLGQGDSWLEAHRDDISLGVDYTPVNVLMKRLGAKRKAQEKEESNDAKGSDN